jgi:hypothetical protein
MAASRVSVHAVSGLSDDVPVEDVVPVLLAAREAGDVAPDLDVVVGMPAAA